MVHAKLHFLYFVSLHIKQSQNHLKQSQSQTTYDYIFYFEIKKRKKASFGFYKILKIY